MIHALGERLKKFGKMDPRLASGSIMTAAAGAAALLAVGYAKLIDEATALMGDLATNHPWILMGISAPCFILAWALVRFGAPAAGGSGIPQLLAAIDLSNSAGAKTPVASVMANVRLILVKIASSLLALLGGGAIGREGPTIQLSAAMFDLFDGAFRRFASRARSREALLIAGGGAGLAAAFNTPIGGIVFAIEELAQSHFRTFKGPLIIAVITAGYVTQAVLGPYLFVGHPAIGHVTINDAIVGLVAAVPIGIAGALFGKALFALMSRVNRLPWQTRLAVAAGTGLMMAAVAALLGPDASGGGALLIKKLLFKDANGVSWAIAIWRSVGVLVTYASGAAGGIFAPALAAGAALGAKVATVTGVANPSVVVVLSMIAYLTGATRSPLTAFTLVFEMTDRQAAVVPMMAAALIAATVARVVEPESFYEKMRDQLLGRVHGAAADPSASIPPDALPRTLPEP